MKLLFVTPYYKPYLGGIERVVEKLGQGLLGTGQIKGIAVLTTKWVFPNDPRAKREYRADLPDKEKIGKFTIYRVNSVPQVAPPFYQVPLVWYPPKKIGQLIEQFNPDVIQLMSDRWFWGNFWAWFYRGSAGVYFSLSFHRLTLAQQLLRPINGLLTRLADKVQVITEHERKLVQKAYWTPKQKLVTIPWGIDLPKSELRNSKSETVKILAVGRVSKHKGQLWLAERFIEAEFKMPAELVFLGKVDDGGYVARIKKIESKIQHEDKQITIAGKVSDQELQRQYQTADLFALFPEYEAFGLVFLEAMSLGVPVLTHDVGAIKEVLQEGATIIPAYNKSAATKALGRLINNHELRKRLAAEAQSYVAKNFSWQKTAQQFLEMYLSS